MPSMFELQWGYDWCSVLILTLNRLKDSNHENLKWNLDSINEASLFFSLDLNKERTDTSLFYAIECNLKTILLRPVHHTHIMPKSNPWTIPSYKGFISRNFSYTHHAKIWSSKLSKDDTHIRPSNSFRNPVTLRSPKVCTQSPYTSHNLHP